jgi:hypothetical protein
LLFVFFSLKSFSQVPFTTYNKPTYKKIREGMTMRGLTGDTSTSKIDSITASQREELGKPDFFDHYSANIITLQNGKKMFPVINGEVVNYGLGLWSTVREIDSAGVKDKKIKDTVTHYLPLSIITKLSGNYRDSSAGVTNDATSFLGAPLTFRLSPSFEIPVDKLQRNKMFAGLNADLRLLTIADPNTSKLEAGWGMYGSVGVTYMGYGYAVSENGRHEGKWSFSSILYAFKSGGTFNKAVFGNYEKKTLSGIEFFLQFKTSKKEDSKFNFLIGAGNGFTRGAPNFGKWEFRIGVGS